MTLEPVGFVGGISTIARRLLLLMERRVGLRRIGEHVVLGSHLGSTSVVVDLGANRGAFSLAIVQAYGAMCHAVEPNPALAALLTGIAGVRCYDRAICEKRGQVRLALSINSEATSLDPAIAGRYGIRGWIDVEGTTLDYFLGENGLTGADLLKVDIEGAELEMFDTASDMTLTAIAQITVEFHEFLDDSRIPRVRAALRRMRKLGFDILVFSSSDWHQVLFLNPTRLGLTRKERWLVALLGCGLTIRRWRAQASLRVRGRSEPPSPITE